MERLPNSRRCSRSSALVIYNVFRGEGQMTTISFSEAAALAYIAKKKGLTRNQKESLTKGFTASARRLVESLGKTRRSPRRAAKKRV